MPRPHATFPPEYDERCRRTLDLALDQLPAYRPWRVRDPGPERPVDERYAALPATTKALIREHFPRGIVFPGRNLEEGVAGGEVELVHTSGTTEERVTTIWHQAWWNASERASWKLNSHAAALATGSQKEALLSSPMSVGVRCDSGYLEVEARTQGRFLFLNEKPDPSAWTAPHVDRMADEIDAFQPVTLEANPSYLARFCRHIADRDGSVAKPALIVLTFEFPSRLHLRQIRRVFPDVPVFSSYGSTETGYVLTQCEAGRFHQNAESCRLDFVPLEPARGAAGIVRMLVTPFGHPWYSLLRFDVADAARIGAGAPCPCGRNSGHVLLSLEGRVRDMTLTPEGRAVTVNELDAAMGGVNGVFIYELRQTSAGAYRLRVVADRGASGDLPAAARAALETVYGPRATIDVAVEPDFPPEPSGKYRLARMMFPFDVDQLFERG